jgi:hypothetical protein
MVLSFPNEILLELFSILPLKALIVSSGVDTKWRHLIPLSPIHPARRALLELYYHVIENPGFLSTRVSVIRSLKSFDRDACVAALESLDICVLPEEFRMWILEWPEKAVFGWVWPGLRCNYLYDAKKGVFCGVNTLEDIDEYFVGMIPFPLSSLREQGIADLRPNPYEHSPNVTRAFCIEVWEDSFRGHSILVADKTQIGTKFYNTVHWFQGEDKEEYIEVEAFTWVEWLRILARSEAMGAEWK